MESLAALAREIAALTGSACANAPERSVSGGSINTCYYWPGGLGPMFVKVGPRASHTAFTAEADGLRELQAVPVSAAISRASAAKGSIPQAAEVIACASGNCESRSP